VASRAPGACAECHGRLAEPRLADRAGRLWAVVIMVCGLWSAGGAGNGGHLREGGTWSRWRVRVDGRRACTARQSSALPGTVPWRACGACVLRHGRARAAPLSFHAGRRPRPGATARPLTPAVRPTADRGPCAGDCARRQPRRRPAGSPAAGPPATSAYATPRATHNRWSSSIASPGCWGSASSAPAATRRSLIVTWRASSANRPSHRTAARS
jgi:hypothetical protein